MSTQINSKHLLGASALALGLGVAGLAMAGTASADSESSPAATAQSARAASTATTATTSRAMQTASRVAPAALAAKSTIYPNYSCNWPCSVSGVVVTATPGGTVNSPRNWVAIQVNSTGTTQLTALVSTVYFGWIPGGKPTIVKTVTNPKNGSSYYFKF